MDHLSHDQLCDALLRITGGVADGNAHLPCRIQIHMIHAGEGHVDELQVFARTDNPATQRHIGDHEHVRILRFTNERILIRCSFIAGQGVPLRLQRRKECIQQFVAYRQRFQQYNVHGKKSLFLCELGKAFPTLYIST